MKKVFLLILAAFLFAVNLNAESRLGISLAAEDLYYINKTICGDINDVFKAGLVLKNGKFLTLKKRIATLTIQVENASNDTVDALTRKLKKAKRKLKNDKAVCQALTDNTDIPGALQLESTTSFSTLGIQTLETFVVGYCPTDGTPDTIWGTEEYTHDSSICTAAAHLGLITLAEGGLVIAKLTPGLSSYIGTTMNGIASSPYSTWSYSFVFIDIHTGERIVFL